MYILEDKDDGDRFGLMVCKLNGKSSSVKVGEKFWGEYRLCMEKGLN